MSEPTETTPATGEQAKAKRERVTKKDYLRKGDDGQVVTVDDIRLAEGIRIEILGAGDPMDFWLSDLPDEPEKNSRNGASIFGLDVVLTNTIGGTRGDEAVENILSRWETLASGEWSSRKGGEGPRISLLAQAIVAAYAKAGQDKDLATVSAALKEKGEEGRKALLANKAFNAEYKRLQAEAATERAEKAAKEAEGAEESLPAI